ncbi:hypothetical protein, partial [Stenotrophomonas sp. HMWF023]|uniref:hypothetical protein n=1 Tax=Stenotrophomonas sp. HMWF023 TaxID=2056859 RepID=UPI001C63935D
MHKLLISLAAFVLLVPASRSIAAPVIAAPQRASPSDLLVELHGAPTAHIQSGAAAEQRLESPPAPPTAPWLAGPLTLLLAAEVTLLIPEGYSFLPPADAAELAGLPLHPGMPGLIRHGAGSTHVAVWWPETGYYPPHALHVDPVATLEALQPARLKTLIPMDMDANEGA